MVAAARGGGIVFVGKLFAWGARLALAVLLARILKADQYGLYNLALTVATVAASFPTLGLDAAIVRYTAVFASRRDVASVLGTLQLGIGVPAVLSIIVAIGVALAAEPIANGLMHEPRLAPLLIIASFLIPAIVLSRQLAATLQGFKRIEYTVLAEQFSQPTVRFVILLIFALLGLTAAYAILASALAALAVTVMLLILVHRTFPLYGASREAKRDPRELMRFSLPVFFSNVVTTLGHNLQTIFLGVLSTVENVGIFAVASHLNLIGSVFQHSVVAASMPLFAESQDRGDRRALEHLYQVTSKWSLSLNLPFFIMILAYPQALLAVFGSEFSAGAAVLVILAWANLINAATGTSGAVLDMTGHTRVKLLNASVAVVLALGLNLLLIPRFGIVGAAIAALASNAAANVLRLIEVYLLERVSPYNRTYLKPIAAGGIAYLASLATGYAAQAAGPIAQVVVALAVLFATYAVVLARLGLDPDDHRVLDRVKGKLLRRRRRRGPDSRNDSDPDHPPTADASGDRTTAVAARSVREGAARG